MNEINDLEVYFRNNNKNLIDKWSHYFDIYDKHFSRFKNTSVNILEIGVSQGGSLQMWKNYFGTNAKIYGVDINPRCKKLEEDQIEIFIGDQEDKSFLESLKNKISRIDILIDDGGHKMKQQINTFEELFPHISNNGIYACEDLLTSYWNVFGGAYKQNDSFIEYSKNFIDYINAWFSRTEELKITSFTKSVYSLNYYPGLIIIEKRDMKKPIPIKSGNKSL